MDIMETFRTQVFLAAYNRKYLMEEVIMPISSHELDEDGHT